MSITNYHRKIETSNGEISIVIDDNSGFCFGVVNAIKKVEQELNNKNELLSLGNIVHNEEEVSRLNKKGLSSINQDHFAKLKNNKILFRAHGEPPESYALAKKNNVEIIDATCPVVLKLQQRIKKAWLETKEQNTQIVIFGKKGHAEVISLVGQTNNEAIVLENENDISLINYNKPIIIFSQTTKSVEDYMLIIERIKYKSNSTFESHDTICRQVANRAPKLKVFANNFDVVVFVGGKNSSNANYLYKVCKLINSETYFISSASELNKDLYLNKKGIGICGATSTPMWLMSEVANTIEETIRTELNILGASPRDIKIQKNQTTNLKTKK